MRTRYFKQASLSDEGKKNLQALASLSHESAGKILDWLKTKEVYPLFDSADRIEIAQSTGESGTVLMPCLSILKMFIDRITEHDDDPEAFYADIKDLDMVDQKTGYKTLDIVFSRLQDIIRGLRLLKRRKLTENFGLPVLIGSTMTAALKPVFSRKFKYNEDSLEKYKPEPIDFAVVGLIELERSDCESVFDFQLDMDNFDRFITDLLALQAEMKILEQQARKITKHESEA
jgi:hypothetical protein